MLVSLHIRNVAVIEDLRLEVGEGLTILTGETGAGKSIVIDALGLVLGDRADSTIIRDGADKAVVEAEFTRLDSAIFGPLAENLDIEHRDPWILRREVSSRGSRCFVNDSPVTVSVLKKIGDLLVDVHGQHDHQALLHAENHGRVLDGCGNYEELLEEWRRGFERFRTAVRNRRQADERRRHATERTILIDHELRQIAAVQPKEGEDHAIERELKVAEQGEKILSGVQACIEDLYGDDRSAMDLLTRSGRHLRDLVHLVPALADSAEQLESIEGLLSDLVRDLRSCIEAIDVSPDHCETLRNRLADLNRLKRMLGSDVATILQRRTELEAERDALEHLDEDLETVRRELEHAREEASRLAALLSARRTETARRLEAALTTELDALGIPRARFAVSLDALPVVTDDEALLDAGRPRGADESGWDRIEFHFSANPGEDLKPLARIISGGEASRVMLALKRVLAEKDAIPVLLFDEIDTGVSGPIAHKVGQAMRALALHHQIIAITHLPQIAALGSAHLLVEKHVRKGRTYTTIRSLSREERIRETARLMSGDGISEAALKNAEQLFHHG